MVDKLKADKGINEFKEKEKSKTRMIVKLKAKKGVY